MEDGQMQRKPPVYDVIALIDLTGCPEGPVLDPLTRPGEIERRYFADWDTPLTPWGGFSLDAGLGVVQEDEDERPVLEFSDEYGGGARGRALIARAPAFRDGRVVAEIRPRGTIYWAHHDRDDCEEALVGIAFRMQTSRAYYQFGIEGHHRAVLYRRQDDEWFVLDEQVVTLPDGYVTLKVILDGDAMHCQCDELDVSFFCTDTTFRQGKAGIRVLGPARVAYVEIAQTEAQRARDARVRAQARAAAQARGTGVPDAVLVRTFDLAELGGTPIFHDFCEPGQYDALIPGKESLRAMTVDGRLLWETSLPVQQQIVFSRAHGDHGRLIYAFTGVREVNERGGIRGDVQRQVVADEMVVLQGRDGKLVARAKVPPQQPHMRYLDYATSSGNLTDTGGFDIVLREWRQDKGGGGVHLWAYDRDLEPLWHSELPGAWYGHHYAVQFYDVDGDGCDELLAGGTLFDAQGNVLWVHDGDREVQHIFGAEHYDAVAIGAFAADEEVDPVAFLLGGSAGVYVVDALTGKTRAVHRIGHAQGRFVGRLRADLPGEQILAVTRWGNYGILTLFSGRGERLWSIQPDYIGQGSCPVQWGAADTQLIWVNTSGPIQALYDGYGQRVKALSELSLLWGDRMRRDVATGVIRMGSDVTDYLSLTVDSRMFVFGPEG
jgi:hypothetical protein